MTINLAAAATLTDGWCLWVRANGGAVTIDPSGAELIDGAATLVIPDGQTAFIICTGTAFFSWGVPSGSLSLTGATPLTLISTDAGVVGPVLDIYHNSASPANSDTPNIITLSANSSTAVKRTLAQLSTSYTDITNASEDADLLFSTMVAGTLTARGQVTASAWAFNSNIRPTADDGAALGVSGTAWSDLFLASGGVINWAAGNITVTHSTGVLDFGAGVYRFNAPLGSTPGSGNNNAGIVLSVATTSAIAYLSSVTQPLVLNRTTDGNVVLVNSGGTNQGAISVSGATVTYGAFFGSHWSQTMDGSKPDIRRGTIVEALDQMCAWPGEQPEERLPRFKVSDTPGSKSGLRRLRVVGNLGWR